MSDAETPATPPRDPRLLPRAIAPGDDAGPLLSRTLRLPCAPGLWSAAAGWTPWQVLLPLALLALVLDGGLAVYRAREVRAELRKWARDYDASFPAVIAEGGDVRVEGGGVIERIEDDLTFLVDPDETVALDSLRTRDAIVVRRREIIRVQAGRTSVTRVADVQQVLGDPLRLDSQSLARFDARWGLVLEAGLGAIVLSFLLVGEVLCAGLCASAGGGLALWLRGRALGRSYAECLRVALAAYAPAIVLGVALNLASASPGACLGMLLWPALVAALATWRVAAR